MVDAVLFGNNKMVSTLYDFDYRIDVDFPDIHRTGRGLALDIHFV